VTMLRGEHASSTRVGGTHSRDELDVAGRLALYVAERHPEVEVLVYDGGQPGDAVQLGVE